MSLGAFKFAGWGEGFYWHVPRPIEEGAFSEVLLTTHGQTFIKSS